VPGSAYTEADLRWLREAIELSRCCPPSETAFSVGAVLVSGDPARASTAVATGFSREWDPHDHAEEVALAKAAAAPAGAAPAGAAPAGVGLTDTVGSAPELTDAVLAGPGLTDAALAGQGLTDAALAGAGLGDATIYTSLEPCLRRLSRPRSCAQLIVAAGIRRVVLAWLEPPLFVPGGGAQWLREQGVTVVEVPELADAARSVNAHLLRWMSR
jgi:diaminohydroxyphosphoribosylaminopyrimidine deaminase/5-amino-6-(5-phosphoribosylamino)uracil reductase